MVDRELVYQLALQQTPLVGDIITKQLISYCGSAIAVFESSTAKLSKIPGIGQKTINALKSKKVVEQAEKILVEAEKNNAEILSYTSPNYPTNLKQSIDSPAILFYVGNANLSNNKIVAIVGTRNATEYGKGVTDDIVAALAPHKPLIVSGLAYGIDIQAHKASIKNGIANIAVMAGGLDRIYPSIHRKYISDIVDNGGIVSEMSYGTTPEAHNFPARNRIIAGMADVVIVVEAAAKGGALITADIANSYDREVFAVPGSLNIKTSEGCNRLIARNEAHIFNDIRDLESLMNWDAKSKKVVKKFNFSSLSNEERAIAELLKARDSELQIDEISWRTQIPINKLPALLINMEFSNILKALPGNKYKLN